MKKRVLAWFCALALAFGLLFTWAAGANPYDNIYLVGVNDTVLLGLINKNRMPVMRSGVLYAPSTVLDNSSLGLSYSYNKTDGMFTIYNRERTLIFYTTGAGARDKQGNEYTDRIFTRNGVVYIPLRFVAGFFDLSYSYYTLNLEDGTVRIARLCNEEAFLDDQRFGAQAAQLAQQPLNQYLASQATPTPTPSATAGPTPTPTPSAPPGPTPSQPPVRPATAYLAFACTDGGGFSNLLDTLERYRVSALLLFDPEDLAGRDEDVRRAAAAGHQIGLLLPQEDAQAAFDKGNRLLGHILRANATQAAFLEGEAQEGNWQVWSGSVFPRGRTLTIQTRNLIEDVQNRGVARVTLTDSAGSASLLAAVLPELAQSPYTLRVATETDS